MGTILLIGWMHIIKYNNCFGNMNFTENIAIDTAKLYTTAFFFQMSYIIDTLVVTKQINQSNQKFKPQL